MKLILWLGLVSQRVTCILTKGHFPPPSKIAHLKRMGLLDDGEGVKCIHCGKLLKGG